MTELNEMEISLKLERIDVCDLLLACTGAMSICRESGANSDKWITLHNKLMKQLESFDKEQGY